MKCKHCQTELEEGTSVCPNCGELQQEHPKKQASSLSAALVILCAVLLTAMVAVIVFVINGREENPGWTEGLESSVTLTPTQNPGVGTQPTQPEMSVSDYLVYVDVADKKSYSEDADALAAAADRVVANAGGYSLTNEALQTFYWSQFNEFMNEYGNYAYYMYGLDDTKPLDAQKINGVDITWEQYFLDGALSVWYQCVMLNRMAQEEGYVLDGDVKEILDEMLQKLEADAIENGFASADALVEEAVGPGCTAESYYNYMIMYWTAMYYSNELYASIEPTEEEIKVYFDEHAAEFEGNGITMETAPFVDVRHILLMPTGGTADASGNVTYSEAEWEACYDAAKAVLDAWTAGEATEESFAQLANIHSKDGGSNTTGGLYQNVTDDGKYVPEFTDWAIAEGRQTGDTGIVRTDYGYHIMYCVQVKEAWHMYAEQALVGQLYNDRMEAYEQDFPITYDLNSIVLGSITQMIVPEETTPATTAPAQ